MPFDELSRHPRVRVRKAGGPNPQGRAVVYWMQRAQRAAENPALDIAIQAANAFPSWRHLRHHAFMADGVEARKTT